MRVIAKFENNGRTTKVYRDSEWNEYRVKFFDSGAYQINADYHTDDKQDALDTAASWTTKGR